MLKYLLQIGIFINLWAWSAFAPATPITLTNNTAFSVHARASDAQTLQLVWQIADDQRLLRDHFSVSSETAGIELGSLQFADKAELQNTALGEQAAFSQQAVLTVPIVVNAYQRKTVTVSVTAQGCPPALADCYAPFHRTVTVVLPDIPASEALTPVASPTAANALAELSPNPSLNTEDELTAEEEFLPAEQAFRLSTRIEGSELIAQWDIADGYYLYRDKFKFTDINPSQRFGGIQLPAGKVKQDPLFGEVSVFYHQVIARLPIVETANADELTLTLGYQGCADAGICYPPITTPVLVSLPKQVAAESEPVSEVASVQTSGLKPLMNGASLLEPATELAPIADTLAPVANSSSLAPAPLSENNSSFVPLHNLNNILNSQFDSPLTETASTEEAFLPPEQAFVFAAMVPPSRDRLIVQWQLAEGYYLYHDKFKFSVSVGEIGEPIYPPAQWNEDQYYGRVQIYRQTIVEIELPLSVPAAATELPISVQYQGCADAGLCYPPIDHQETLSLPEFTGGIASSETVNTTEPQASDTPAAETITTVKEEEAEPAKLSTTVTEVSELKRSEQDRIADMLMADNIFYTLLMFFGFGLLLSFTPCVFPMIPILSSIIVGQDNVNTRSAFFMSLTYVLAMASTYAIAGVFAGLVGESLQTALQTPAVAIVFALVFIALALSMFGFYNLQLPSSWQTSLSNLSNNQRGGTLIGVAIMGMLSALIVGPCVAAPLAGALIYIGQSQDALLGGLALFSMGLGMGVPLLLIGTSAGRLLPKAGLWMDAVKAVFGVLLLATAIWLISWLLAPSVVLLLWAILLIVSAVFMGALEPVDAGAGWRKLWKGVGVLFLIYGTVLIIGAASGARSVWQPLAPFSRTIVSTGSEASPMPVMHTEAKFKQVKGLAGLQQALAEAEGKPVLLDFYADWCVSCKEMEHFTFTDPQVQQALSDFVLLQTDVTANDAEDKALYQHFGIFGPPAIMFYDGEGQEVRGFRVVGFMPASPFYQHLQEFLQQ